MKQEDLLQIKQLIGDMRFIQAMAMVAANNRDAKESIAYMRSLVRLNKVIDDELEKGKTP